MKNEEKGNPWIWSGKKWKWKVEKLELGHISFTKPVDMHPNLKKSMKPLRSCFSWKWTMCIQNASNMGTSLKLCNDSGKSTCRNRFVESCRASRYPKKRTVFLQITPKTWAFDFLANAKKIPGGIKPPKTSLRLRQKKRFLQIGRKKNCL